VHVEEPGLPESSNPFPAPFQALLDRIPAAVEREDLDRALELANEAIAWGHEHGDSEALDRARCNRAGFLIALERPGSVATDLQTILMRTRRISTRYLAAYNLSILHFHRRNLDRSIFYTRLAIDYAERTSSIDWEIRSLNRLGVALCAQSHLKESLCALDTARGKLPPGDSVRAVTVSKNLGYCLLLLERFGEGFGALARALRMARRLKRGCQGQFQGIHLPFCYGYIQIGRIDHARRHGEKALELARASDDHQHIKPALYLLGEIEKQAGNEDRAFACFQTLQHDYHADMHDLADLLMAVETHQLVNLMA